MESRGVPAPEWLLDMPQMLPGEDFYLRSFWELSTERQVGFTIGAIPSSRIDEWAARNGLDADNMDLFRAMIRMLDEAYIKWSVEQQAKARESHG